MATNFVQEGDVVTVVAPFAAVRGRYIIVNATTKFGGVALDNANSAANVQLKTRGVFTFSKVNAVSTSGLAGGYVYWDNTNSNVTISATSNTLIGCAVAAFSNTETSVTVRLNGSF